MKTHDCETCPLSWEDRGYDDIDCGCWVYEDLYGDEIICRFPNFIKRLILNAKKRKRDKALERQYDGIVEYFEEKQRKDAAFRQAVEECILKNKYGEELILCREDIVGNRYKVEICEEYSLARMRYEEILEEREDK
jgi:hypothetical protein